jgi:sugar lactone lactonase YvrE
MKALNRVRSILFAILLIGIAALLVLVFLIPSPIVSVSWTPLPGPAWTGPLAINHELTSSEFLGQEQLHQPESVNLDDKGRLYAGCSDGNIYRLTLDTVGKVITIETFARVKGYPLALHFDKDGNLISAVKGIGLMSFDAAGNATLLTNKVNDTPITYANDLDITSDGIIYFTDSSIKFDRGWPYDVLEGRPHGRFLSYEPNTKTTRLIKDDLYFANGVKLAPDENFVLVGETARYRIARYWLKGPKAGTWDYFTENLPSLVDNIRSDDQGNYYVAGNRRLAPLDNLLPFPFIKNQLAKIPFNILSGFPTWKNNRFGLILVLDKDGILIRSLQDPTGRVYGTSTALPYKGYLYIGSLFGDGIARYPLNSK